MAQFPSSAIWKLNQQREAYLGDLLFPNTETASGLYNLDFYHKAVVQERFGAAGGGGGGGVAATGDGYADSYIANTGGTKFTYSIPGNINTVIDGMSDGDALVLGIGAYTVNCLAADSYSSDMFRRKNILITGETADASDVVLEPLFGAQRGKHIFTKNTYMVPDFTRQLAFLRLNRTSSSGTNYINALAGAVSGSMYKGVAVNCIIDINGDVSWTYDNNNTSGDHIKWVRCSFVNYTAWDNKYTGNLAGITVQECVFETTYQTGVNLIGVSYSNVAVDANYNYNAASYVAGHLFLPEILEAVF